MRSVVCVLECFRWVEYVVLFGRVAWFLTSGHVRKGPPAPCVCSSKFGCRTIHILSILTFLDHWFRFWSSRKELSTSTQQGLAEVHVSPEPKTRFSRPEPSTPQSPWPISTIPAESNILENYRMLAESRKCGNHITRSCLFGNKFG